MLNIFRLLLCWISVRSSRYAISLIYGVETVLLRPSDEAAARTEFERLAMAEMRAVLIDESIPDWTLYHRGWGRP